MRIDDIEYHVDGRRMVGRLAVDDASDERRPAILLCHEGPGLDDHVKGRAERVAALGYVAFALDYHGEGTPLPFPEAQARLQELIDDPGRTRTIAKAGLDVLLSQPQVDASRVAAIGYCFGGSMVLELGRAGTDLKAIVGFHPGLRPSSDSVNIKGSVLMCIGVDDPILPPDVRRAFEQDMIDAHVADWRVELYGGVGHSFTNAAIDQFGLPGFSYDARADHRSWLSMVDLLDQVFAPQRAELGDSPRAR